MSSNGTSRGITVTARLPLPGDPYAPPLDFVDPAGLGALQDEAWWATVAARAEWIDEGDVWSAEDEAAREARFGDAVDIAEAALAAESLPVETVLAEVEACGPGPQGIALLASLGALQKSAAVPASAAAQDPSALQDAAASGDPASPQRAVVPVVTAEQRLRVLELWQRQLAWVTGAEQAAMVALVGHTPDPSDRQAVLADEFMPTEVGLALGATSSQAKARIAYARALHEQFSATGAKLRAGELDVHRVWVITDVLSTVGRDIAAHVEADWLPRAAGLTTGKLARELKNACRAADPDWNLRQFVKARKTRRVGFRTDGEDGLFSMYAALPPVEAMAMQQHLGRAARVPSPDPDDVRTVDERMADALIASVLGSTPGDPTTPLTPKVTMQVLVPLSTLLGLREDCGELRGYGSIPSGLARQLAGDADWQRWVCEDVNGHLLDLGKHRYRPDGELDPFTRARDRYCRFPSCNRHADGCDLDHTEPFNHDNGPDCYPDNSDLPPDDDDPPDDDAPDNGPPDTGPPDDGPPEDGPPGSTGPAASGGGGPDNDGDLSAGVRDDGTRVAIGDACCPHPGGATAASNLAALCRPAHRAKTHGGYRTEQDADGTLHLTTPLGRSYQTRPWDYRPWSDR